MFPTEGQKKENRVRKSRKKGEAKGAGRGENNIKSPLLLNASFSVMPRGLALRGEFASKPIGPPIHGWVMMATSNPR